MGIQSKYNTVKEIMNLRDFYICQTGGGCTAYRHETEDGHEILITDDSHAPENIDDLCIVGLYNKDGEQLTYWEDLEGIEQALHAAKYYVAEYFLDND